MLIQNDISDQIILWEETHKDHCQINNTKNIVTSGLEVNTRETWLVESIRSDEEVKKITYLIE